MVDRMSATDQEILDAARDALKDILTGRTEEFREASESARLLRIQELRATIREFEAKVRAVNGNVLKPIREVAL
jgi:hypothetical protein